MRVLPRSLLFLPLENNLLEADRGKKQAERKRSAAGKRNQYASEVSTLM